MNRYDELCAKFSEWHDDATTVQNGWRRLPFVLSEAVRKYLGAPEFFSDVSLTDEKKETNRYVSLATARWNDNTESFELKIKEGGPFFFEQEILPSDGRFYFALAVFLERGPRVYPKQPFWFLFSLGWESKDQSSLRIQRTGQTFMISHIASDDDSSLEPACKAINDLLLEDLSFSPYEQREKTALRRPQE